MTLLPQRRAVRARPDALERWHTVDGRAVCTRHVWIEPSPRVPDDPRRALNGLMRFAAGVWAEIAMLWGGPRAMLRTRAMPAQDWRLARDWIFHLEQLVRRILLIAALTLNLRAREHDQLAVRSAPRPVRESGRAPARENANSPRTWRVSFHAMPANAEPSDHDRPAAIPARRARPLAFKPTRGLARRMEALVRAIRHGRVHARRLAHRLARLAARNARANRPRLLGVPYWDFHPHARTSGKHAVNTAMQKAAILSIRALTRWNMRCERPEPG